MTLFSLIMTILLYQISTSTASDEVPYDLLTNCGHLLLKKYLYVSIYLKYDSLVDIKLLIHINSLTNDIFNFLLLLLNSKHNLTLTESWLCLALVTMWHNVWHVNNMSSTIKVCSTKAIVMHNLHYNSDLFTPHFWMTEGINCHIGYF